jgi:hypothetical protein
MEPLAVSRKPMADATKAPNYTFRIGGRRGLDLLAATGYIDSENVR